jgi:hypothetical protein
MTCQWVLLGSLTTAQRLCGEPGHPFCEEHQKMMEYLNQLDKDFEEIEETHRAICEESQEL